MADRTNLRAAALFTLLLITEAMYTAPMRAAKRNMRPMVRKVLKDLGNSSTCKSTEGYSIDCLAVTNGTSECDLVSIYDAYLTEAADLDIQPLVTEQLQAINQYLQGLQNDLCATPEPDGRKCGPAFKGSDGDYENVCKVTTLLQHLQKWLYR